MLPLALWAGVLAEEALVAAGTWIVRGIVVAAGLDAASKVIAKAKEKSEEKDCRCPAAGSCQGKYSPNLRSDKSFASSKSDSWLRYQLRIANLKAGPERFAVLPSGIKNQYQVTEWSYNGVPDFDGFWRAQCTLVEAKGNYDQFLTLPFASDNWWREVLLDMRRQMVKHYQAATPPPVRVEWHFMKPEVLMKITTTFGPSIAMLNPRLTTHVTP